MNDLGLSSLKSKRKHLLGEAFLRVAGSDGLRYEMYLLSTESKAIAN